MGRLALAAVAVVSLVAISVSTALAQWPTSCTELNDLVEAGRGNHENVGIYVRVHGDQAEAVCQSEHRDSGLRFGVRPYQLPSKSEPAAYTQAFVERAIHRYNTEGLQATLDYYNSPQSIDGQWYIFIADADTMLAHAAIPVLVGRNTDDIKGPDGFPVNEQIAAVATEDGAWVDYTWVNPNTGESETKHSWVVVQDDILFGSGWYEPGPSRDEPATYTQHVVQRAIGLYDDVGLEAVVDYYNSPQSIDGQWYVFIFDENDLHIANAANPHLVVLPAEDVRGPDGFPTGLHVVAAATGDGAWVDYTWVNPESGDSQTKHSWAVRHDGLVFGSGWYEPGPSKAKPAAYTQAIVERAIDLYEGVGRDVTIDYYNTVESVDGPWYVFIINVDDGLTIGHYRPEIRGRDPSLRVDVTGYFYGDDLLAADENGRWVDYVFLNPATGEQETKHTWAVRRDGLIFGSGWYSPSKSDAAGYTQAFVSRALSRYDAEGRDATVAYYNNVESIDGPWYVFIINVDDGLTIGHYRPEIRGRDPNLRVDVTGYFYGDDLLAADGEGHWVSYVFLNPETGEQQTKHTWAIRHDGLIFASGWYE